MLEKLLDHLPFYLSLDSRNRYNYITYLIYCHKIDWSFEYFLSRRYQLDYENNDNNIIPFQGRGQHESILNGRFPSGIGTLNYILNRYPSNNTTLWFVDPYLPTNYSTNLYNKLEDILKSISRLPKDVYAFTTFTKTPHPYYRTIYLKPYDAPDVNDSLFALVYTLPPSLSSKLICATLRLLPYVNHLFDTEILLFSQNSWERRDSVLHPSIDYKAMTELGFYSCTAWSHFGCEEVGGFLGSSQMNLADYCAMLTYYYCTYGGDENILIQMGVTDISHYTLPTIISRKCPQNLDLHVNMITYRNFESKTIIHNLASSYFLQGIKPRSYRYNSKIVYREIDTPSSSIDITPLLINLYLSYLAPMGCLLFINPDFYLSLFIVSLYMFIFLILISYNLLNAIYYRTINYLFVPLRLPSNPGGLFSIGNEPYPATPIDPTTSLLIPCLGTHGDIKPLEYFGRVAAYFGIRTHLWIVHRANQFELDELKKGNLTVLLLPYLGLRSATTKGYKFIFNPHVSLGGNSSQYNMAPSTKWINPIKYTDTGKDTIQSRLAKLLAYFNVADLHIGSLSDCDLPRSHDGQSLIHRLPNENSGKEAYCVGSGSKNVIPLDIQQSCDEIKAPYHYSIFTKYSKVHVLGGAGTVQSVLACGAEPIIYDKLLDRDYHTMPTPNDITIPSLVPFLYLLISNFDTSICLFYRLFIYFTSLFVIINKSYKLMLLWSLRVYTLYLIFMNYHLHIILIVLSCPFILEFSVSNKYVQQATRTSISILIKYPILGLLDRLTYFHLVALLSSFAISNILNDVHSFYHTYSVIKIRRVKTFPLPYGHVSVHSLRSNETFEGRFLTYDAFNQPFKAFIGNTNALAVIQSKLSWALDFLFGIIAVVLLGLLSFLLLYLTDNLILFLINILLAIPFLYLIVLIIFNYGRSEIEIPVPLELNAIRHIMFHESPYSLFHNCQTVIFKQVYRFSIISTLLIVYIYFFSWFVLGPGQVVDMLDRYFNISKILDIPAFAGATNYTHNPIRAQKNWRKIKAICDIIYCIQFKYKVCKVEREKRKQTDKYLETLITSSHEVPYQTIDYCSICNHTLLTCECYQGPNIMDCDIHDPELRADNDTDYLILKRLWQLIRPLYISFNIPPPNILQSSIETEFAIHGVMGYYRKDLHLIAVKLYEFELSNNNEVLNNNRRSLPGLLETLIHESTHITHQSHSEEFNQTFKGYLAWWYNSTKDQIILNKLMDNQCQTQLINPDVKRLLETKIDLTNEDPRYVNENIIKQINDILEEIDTGGFIEEQSVESTINNIALLIHLYQASPDNTEDIGLTEDELIDIGLDSIYKRYTGKLTEEKLQSIIHDFEIPPYSDAILTMYKETGKIQDYWIYIVTKLQALLEPLYNIIPQLKHFIDWLLDKTVFVSRFITNFLKNSSIILGHIWQFSQQVAIEFMQLVQNVIDLVFPSIDTKRIKTVWGLSGLVLTPYLSKRLQMEQSISTMHALERTNPIADLQWTLDNINQFSNQNPLFIQQVSTYLNPLEPVDYHHGTPIYYIDDDLYITDTTFEENDTLTPYINCYPLTSSKYYKQKYININNPLSLNFGNTYSDNIKITPNLSINTTLSGPNMSSTNTIIHDDGDLLDMNHPHATLHLYDYDSKLTQIREEWKSGISEIHRDVRIPTLALSEQECIKYDLKAGQYKIVKELTDRNNRYLGITEQGMDGVVTGVDNSHLLAKASNRYAPKYIPLDDERRIISKEVADAIIDFAPKQFLNSRITPVDMIPYYLDPKLKYSPGIPYLAKLKTRRQLRELGYEDALIKATLQNFRNGIYPNQFYHLFGKSQVVAAEKILAGKNIRTVSAQDLTTYFIDQVIQLERNKRVVWRDFGIGIGMILNQNMVYLFEQLNKFKSEGGVIVEADCSEFDSRLNPFSFAALDRLAERSFENHWKGKEIHSVMTSKYDQMQDAWMFGLTERQHNIFSLSLQDKHLTREFLQKYPDRYITYHKYLEQYNNNDFLRHKIILVNNEAGYINEPIFVLTNQLQHKHKNIISLSGRNLDPQQIIEKKQWLKEQQVKNIYLVDHHELVPSGVIPYVDPTFIQKSLHSAEHAKIIKWHAQKEYIPNLFWKHAKSQLQYYPSNVTISDYHIIPHLGEICEVVPQSYRHPKLKLTQEGPTIRDQYLAELELYRQNKSLVGNIHPKNRGGGTGQSATSFDNTWAFRANFYAGLYKYYDYKKSLNDIVKKLTLVYNNGDDSMIGYRIKRKHLDMNKLIDAYHYFGMDMEVEFHTDIEHIQYLGNKVYRLNKNEHPNEWYQYSLYKQLKHKSSNLPMTPNPKLLVYHDPSSTLLRRTSTRYYQASVNSRKYLHSWIMKTCGQGLLTAWNPDLWLMFANEYIDDVKQLAQYYHVNPNTLNISIKTDQKLSRDDRYFKQVHFVRKKPSPEMKENEKEFWGFVNQFKYPTYYQVLTTQLKMREEDINKYEMYLKKYYKAETWFRDIPNAIADDMTNFFQKLPRQWYKMQAPLLTLYPEPTFYTKHRNPEKFMWLSNWIYKGRFALWDNTKEEFTNMLQREDLQKMLDQGVLNSELIPDTGMMTSIISQSHLGGCCDSYAFIYNLNNNPEYWKEIVGYQDTNNNGRWTVKNDPINQYSGLVSFATATYLMLYFIELFIMSVPIISTFWNLLLKYYIDIPKLYALGNSAYWHYHGKSSTEISSIIPRDLYLFMKRFSVFIADIVPQSFGHIFYVRPWFFFLSLLFQNYAIFFRRWQMSKEGAQDRPASAGSIDNSLWLNATNTKSEFVRLWGINNSDENIRKTAMVITSGTSTGKSSRFPAALRTHFAEYISKSLISQPFQGYFRMIILVPRRILVAGFKIDGYQELQPNIGDINYHIDGLNGYYQKLRKNVPIDLRERTNFYIMTYGHFNVRYRNSPELRDLCTNAIVMFDEFHELSADLLQSYDLLNHSYSKLLLSSATPTGIPEIPSVSWSSGFPNRHKLIVIERDDTTLNMHNFICKHPDYAKYGKDDGQIIIREPVKKNLAKVAEGLAEAGEPHKRACHVLSRDNADEPIPSDKLVIATNIINAGVDLPGRSLMIDAGKTRGYHRNNWLDNIWTSPLEYEQIRGRVGRSRDSVYLVNPKAGTGKILKPYASITNFMYPTVASHFQVAQLTNYHPNPEKSLAIPIYPFLTASLNNNMTNEEYYCCLLVLIIEADQLSDETANQLYRDLASEIETDNNSYLYHTLTSLPGHIEIFNLLRTKTRVQFISLVKRYQSDFLIHFVSETVNRSFEEDGVKGHFNIILPEYTYHPEDVIPHTSSYIAVFPQYKGFTVGIKTNNQIKKVQLNDSNTQLNAFIKYIKQIPYSEARTLSEEDYIDIFNNVREKQVNTNTNGKKRPKSIQPNTSIPNKQDECSCCHRNDEVGGFNDDLSFCIDCINECNYPSNCTIHENPKINVDIHNTNHIYKITNINNKIYTIDPKDQKLDDSNIKTSSSINNGHKNKKQQKNSKTKNPKTLSTTINTLYKKPIPYQGKYNSDSIDIQFQITQLHNCSCSSKFQLPNNYDQLKTKSRKRLNRLLDFITKKHKNSCASEHLVEFDKVVIPTGSEPKKNTGQNILKEKQQIDFEQCSGTDITGSIVEFDNGTKVSTRMSTAPLSQTSSQRAYIGEFADIVNSKVLTKNGKIQSIFSIVHKQNREDEFYQILERAQLL